MTEVENFELIHQIIQSIKKSKPVRIAINGIEGTGKTTFANRLELYLISKSEPVLNISIDGFHFNKKHRYQKGRDSAVGYYEDSYDELAFVNKVLLSSQNERPTITKATHDLETDEYLDLEPTEIARDTILITDGAYLFKPVYQEHWDLKIYLITDFETALSRGSKRDSKMLGGLENSKKKFIHRYHAASKIYISENNPKEVADIIINNTDFNNLVLEKNVYSSSEGQ